ncbi:Plasma membrane G protein coupled receptor (GPCR) [Metarhizium rileyi]|uniref:Plasma membrane G protein coupled receptor (GPCR) n=1 Tax=Metarhizium rileyi (strain RCEF 4871) TaxID=1649241 RepID=A0A167ADM0_METRR|nr:Plasma membrane G protein coupled receptor (GPCR) [Metarhizium rileyi RCEF 4871]
MVSHPVRHEGTASSRGLTLEGTSNWGTTTEHVFQLNVAAVVVGSLSLLATLVAVAFFLRMRRSFRHDLILLLILSDMLSTLWLVLLPAIELSNGRIPSNSTFCQISGFFLSLGIEACDLTVLLMAIHTALYIFRGRSGLYPYRYLAYAVVVTGSLTLTSLAFINKPGFVNSGPYCYFPARPSWTLRCLSWLPRYFVCVFVMLTYTCIYVYVRWIMIQVNEPTKRRKVEEPFPSRLQPPSRRGSVPPTPPITYYGLIPPTPPHDSRRMDYLWSRSAGSGQNGRLKKESLIGSDDGQSLPQPVVLATSPLDHEEQHPILTKDPFKHYSQRPHDANDPKDEDIAMSPMDRPPTGQRSIGCSCVVCAGSDMPQVLPLLKIEVRLQDDSREAESLPSLVLSPTTLNGTGMPESRHKIRRQLRQLFIYPLVYILGWILPFVAQRFNGEE